ncbi:MAG: hypothetical protein V4615_10955 [Bacteroidota bacterium]
MNPPKTKDSTIGDLFALSRTEQPVDDTDKINWTQVGIQFGATVVLLLIFYFMITHAFENHIDRLIAAHVPPPEKAAEQPGSVTGAELPSIEPPAPEVRELDKSA